MGECVPTFSPPDLCAEVRAKSPYDEVTGVDAAAVLGSLEVPRVPHHSAGPAAFGAGVHVKHLIRNDLEQLLHHFSEVGWMPL